MDPAIVEKEIKSHKMKEGLIYQRTKFLQEWQERWMVITLNYVYIFANNSLKQVTDCYDLNDLTTYKSFLRKEHDMIPAGFRLNVDGEDNYFCARNVNEKWVWFVALERTMDYKSNGKSIYNSLEMVQTRGFMGQQELARGKFNEPPQAVPEPPKIKEPTKEFTAEVERLKKRQQALLAKEKEQEEIFLFELNKLKKAEEALKELQQQVELKKHEMDAMTERMIEEMKAQPVEVPPPEILEEKPVEKTEEAVAQKETNPTVKNEESQPEPIKQQPEPHKQEPEPEPIKEEPQPVPQPEPQPVKVEPEPEPVPELPKQEPVVVPQQEPQIAKTVPASVQRDIIVNDAKRDSHVSQLRKMFESKMDLPQDPNQMKASLAKTSMPRANKVPERKSKDETMHLSRDRVVVNLFQQFHAKAYQYKGLRTIIEFLIKICAERGLGYQQFLVREAKAHENRFLFGQVMMELVNDFKDYTSSDKLCKVLQILLFQVPTIFKPNHFDLIKKKLVDILYNCPDPELAPVIKTMYVVHKNKQFSKDAKLKQRITEAMALIPEGDGRNWAKRLLDDQ